MFNTGQISHFAISDIVAKKKHLLNPAGVFFRNQFLNLLNNQFFAENLSVNFDGNVIHATGKIADIYPGGFVY